MKLRRSELICLKSEFQGGLKVYEELVHAPSKSFLPIDMRSFEECPAHGCLGLASII